MKEIWKDIKGFEGLYQVSDHGRVRSMDRFIEYSNGIIAKHKGKLLKFDKSKENKRGQFYLRVTLSKEDKQKRLQVHRLVAKHFIDKVKGKNIINHIDGNPENNHFSNLEWCSYSQNEKHSYDVLGKINQNRKLSDEAINDIKNNAIKGVFPFNKIKGNIYEFAKKYNVDRTTVLNILNKKYYV